MTCVRGSNLLSFTVLPLLVACGGASKAGEESHAAGPLSPGQQCLADAEAPRDPGENAPRSIEVSHILIRHAELARPQGATLGREAACLRALEALSALNENGNWDQVAEEFSDSGKSTGGELGSVRRDEVTGPFGDAAFSLDVNELSYVVESDRGFHIILRTN